MTPYSSSLRSWCPRIKLRWTTAARRQPLPIIVILSRRTHSLSRYKQQPSRMIHRVVETGILNRQIDAIEAQGLWATGGLSKQSQICRYME